MNTPRDEELLDLAERVLAAYRARGRRIATAESCTGGLVSGYLTAIAGSSDVLDRGFVTYSNAAKTELLGVPAELIAAHGAVSAPVADAMAGGALRRAGVEAAVSLTGVAGPGQSERKPAGLVFIGCAILDGSGDPAVTVSENRYDGDRTAVRLSSVRTALEMLLSHAVVG